MIPDNQIEDEIGLDKVKLKSTNDKKLRSYLNKRIDTLVAENERRENIENFTDVQYFIGLSSYDVLVKIIHFNS